MLIFGVVNLLAATLSSASGGGAGLVTTPFMVLLGLTPAQAIATAKFNGLGTSVGATARFFREKITDRKTVIIFSVIGAIGALIGSLTLAYFRNETEILQKLMGLVILFIGVPMLYVRKAGRTTRNTPRWFKICGWVLLGLSVFMQAALGSGIGSLQMIIFVSCFGMTALVASATRRFMQLTVATVALSVLIISGLVNWHFGLVALATSLVGGYCGAHLAIKKGDQFVLNLFAGVSVVLALQLIFGKS